MERDREDWGRVIADRIRERVVDERNRRLAHADRARRAARLLAGRIGREPGVRRVVLFGSLAGGIVGPGSDIDLAVEGLAVHREWALKRELMDMTPIPFDLVRIEEARPSLRRRIDEEGEVLYVAG